MKSSKKFLLILRFTSFSLIFATFFGCGHDSNVVQSPYDLADAIDGGRLYDQFWAAETSFSNPKDPSVNMEAVTKFPDFYRCKQCHGWDLKGKEGAYIGRGPTSTRPNVSVGIELFVANNSPEVIFNAIKNSGGAKIDPNRTSNGTDPNLGGDQHPDYSLLLSDEQIWNITKFLKTAAMDVDQLYDFTLTGKYPSGSIKYANIGKDGNLNNGNSIYQSSCSSSSCHGTNGTGPILADGITVGKFIRSKPYEAHHKIKFGQLGSVMTGFSTLSTEQIKALYAALSDKSKFPD